MKCPRQCAKYIFNAVPGTSSSPTKRPTLQQRPSGTSGGGAFPSDSQFSAGFIVNEVQLRHLILPVLRFTMPIISTAGVRDSTLYEEYVRPLYAAWWVSVGPNCTYRLSLVQIALCEVCCLKTLSFANIVQRRWRRNGYEAQRCWQSKRRLLNYVMVPGAVRSKT
jgi:hypothetical protein